jgi:Xaa-Pro aminopeptidase
MQQIPKEEIDRRIRELQKRMRAEGFGAALIIQNADLYYFCGTVPQGYMFVPASGEPVLFVRKNPDRIRGESPLQNIVPIQAPRDLPRLLSDCGYAEADRLGMELDVLPVNQFIRLRDILRPRDTVDISPLILSIRSIKSEFEIAAMRTAAGFSDRMIAAARAALREGMREVELAAAIEAAARMEGHPGFVRMRAFNQEVYWGAVVSGRDAAETNFIDFAEGGRGTCLALPSGAGPRPIRRGEPVMYDYVSVDKGYYIDQSRTLCLGKLPAELDRAYRLSMDILRGMESMLRPGTMVHELYAEAERIAESGGLGENLQGFGKNRAGFIGHGIGLELDEIPAVTRKGKATLQSGMVLAIEPKFMFPGLGVVGVEDNYVIRDTGPERLTGAPYDVAVGEK